MIFFGLMMALGVLVTLVGLPAFETVAILLLLSTVFAQPLGALIGLGWYAYIIILGAGLAGLYLVQRSRGAVLLPLRALRMQQLTPLFVWVGGAIALYLICLLWPDFISLGERLRDYAILSSVLQHPLEAREPWMSGATLNYYLFWYRFGHLLYTLGGLEIWEVYHLLQAITFSLYFTCFYQLASRYLGLSTISSLAVATIISLGSNLSGIVAYAKQDTNWWGPSRVIPGAINEFPSWSFLLGDLHPHFLNLPLWPLMILSVLALAPIFANNSVPLKIIIGFCAGAMAATWTFAANAWELPFALIILGGMTLGFLFALRRFQGGAPGSPKSTLAICTCILICLVTAALVWQSRNISPPGDPIRLVVLPLFTEQLSGVMQSLAEVSFGALQAPLPNVQGTSVDSLILHWGGPLVICSLALVLLSKNLFEGVGKLLVLGFGYLSGSALVLLFFLLLLSIWRFIESSSEPTKARRIIELVGIAALIGLIAPEIIFVDDPYGGADERMNTIFKFYSAAWGFMHLYAVLLAQDVWIRWNIASKIAGYSGAMWAAVVIVSIGFFISTVRLRKTAQFTIKPYEQGLSSVDNQFPGSGATIQKLALLPKGVVIEAQSGAYNYSSMIATLSSNESFLGWSNHVGLLTRRYDEVGRREAVVRAFYTAGSCEERRNILGQELIRYAVLGPLERQAFGGFDSRSFECLTRIIKEGGFEIFSAPD